MTSATRFAKAVDVSPPMMGGALHKIGDNAAIHEQGGVIRDHGRVIP